MTPRILQRPTLVLNRNWQPVNVATVARALVLLWNESARVVDPADYQLYTWEDWSKLRPRDGEPFIQAVRFRLRVPEVVALTRLRPAAGGPVTFSRRNIFKRDHYTCQYCGAQPGSEELTIDHVVPRVAGWRVELGELRAGVHGLQQAEGRPHAGAGADAAAQAAGPADVEAAVRGPRRADRKLVEVRQRSVLERDAARVVVTPRAPGPQGRGPIQECAPGRAGGLQSRRTGFDSSRSCLIADVAEQRGGGFVNRIDAGANPVVGSGVYVPMV